MGAILEIKDAGLGETPTCPAAKFKPNDVVRVRRLKHLGDLPEKAVIVVVVPPGFPAEYALADLHRRPRPLMVTKPKRGVSYIVGVEGDRRPWLLREAVLQPSGDPPAVVRWADDEAREATAGSEAG